MKTAQQQHDEMAALFDIADEQDMVVAVLAAGGVLDVKTIPFMVKGFAHKATLKLDGWRKPVSTATTDWVRRAKFSRRRVWEWRYTMTPKARRFRAEMEKMEK